MDDGCLDSVLSNRKLGSLWSPMGRTCFRGMSPGMTPESVCRERGMRLLLCLAQRGRPEGALGLMCQAASDGSLALCGGVWADTVV